VTLIGYAAFADNQLRSVVVPNCKVAGINAFSWGVRRQLRYRGFCLF